MQERCVVLKKLCEAMKSRRMALGYLLLAVLAALSTPITLADPGPGFNTTVPSQIVEQFRDSRVQWTTNVFTYANALFGILAVIEFAWSAAVMLLEKADFQSWTSALIRKLMWIGAFYALLLNGRFWIPAIIDSFTQIGQNAAGVSALSPSGVFMQGLSLAGALMDGASTSAFFTNPGTSLALAFAALLIVISYTIIAINFIVTLVESYIVVSVGFIFLGFGGSRWTAPYTERYIGLAVSIGVKIVLLYCLIAAGFNLSLGWLNEAQGISTSTRPAMSAFDVMGGALIFMMCCWQIPKLFAAVIGGAPALTGGDLIATAAAVGSAALTAGAAAATGAGALAGAVAGTSSAASAGGAAGSSTSSAISSVGSVGAASSSGGAAVSPPAAAAAGASSAGSAIRKQPDPPTSSSASPGAQAISSIGGEPLAGSGFERQVPSRGFASAAITASEEAAPAHALSSFGSPTDDAVASDSPRSSDFGARERPASASRGSSSAPSDIASLRTKNPESPQPPSAAKVALDRAADQVQAVRRRLRSLPSDAAPHATPPRIPIEHEE
jgi:type IV secretion system protein TrbL